jgi:hypothetical protein
VTLVDECRPPFFFLKEEKLDQSQITKVLYKYNIAVKLVFFLLKEKGFQ